MPQPLPFILDPRRSALVIVDMQNFWVRGRERHSAAVEGNVVLLRKAREAGVPVIFIQSVRTADALEVTRFGCDPMLLEDTEDVEIVEEIAPLASERVVKKWSHDPWARTLLEDVLAELGIVADDWTVLVTGVSAAVCAHACVLGFSNRHYMTLVPMDCTAAGSVESEALVYSQYTSVAYNYNIAFTRSDLVTFGVGASSVES